MVPIIYWVMSTIGKNISETFLTKGHHILVTHGPYRWVRHPLYSAATVVFVSLELEASGSTLAPGEHRKLTVRVRGSAAKVNLEARNLAPEVAELQGGTPVRAISTGGAENVASFELVGKQRGNFVISIRLVAPLGAPRT